MVESTALEMRRTGNRTVGSNPTPSAKLVTLGLSSRLPVGEKGPVARRRPKSAREAYFLYVERIDEGANEANGPLSATGAGGPC